MFNTRRIQSPLIAGLLLLGALIALACWRIVSKNGAFCYPLDDAFIHMAVSKNLGLYGTWGINSTEFGSASSSPLYTLLMAAFFAAGVKGIMMPLWLNIFMAAGVVYTMHRMMRELEVAPLAATLILAAVILFTPLHFLAVTGMEHVLHLWLVLLCMQQTLALVREKGSGANRLLLAALFGALAVLARFESLFLIAAIVLLLLCYRRFTAAVVMIAAAFLPLVLFAWYSLAQGGYALPNSILLKGGKATDGISQVGGMLQEIILHKLIHGNNTLMRGEYYPMGTPSLSGISVIRLLLILPALVIFIKALPQKTATAVYNLALLVTGATFLHLALASVDWLFRYEAYLMAAGLFAGGIMLYYLRGGIAGLWNRGLLQKAVMLFLAAYALAPLGVRALNAVNALPKASRNIYEQQYQMGRFVAQYYAGQTVAVNDIGAVSYLGNSRVIDLWGLGNNEVAKSKIEHSFSIPFVQQLIGKEQVKIAVIYNSVFDHSLYDRWTKVATWSITDNVVCAGTTVVFYAIRPEDAPQLLQNLQQFEASLPPKVTVSYFPIR
jgi:hypothetical protein